MPLINPEQKIFAIVLTGEFNPSIFHPAWLSQNELVATEEAEDAEDIICTNEVSSFVLDGVHFQVERHRFGLTAKDESKAPWIRDLTDAVFSLLEHTPLTAMGLNLNVRYALEDMHSWHKIGHTLAPKDCWKDILEDPGMLSISVRGKRNNCSADRIDFNVQPVPSPINGILIGVNQHYDLKTDKQTSVYDRNRAAKSILKDDWNKFRSYATKASSELLRNALVGTTEGKKL